MSSGKKKSTLKRSGNRRRGRKTAYDGLVSVNRRAHEKAENRLGQNRRMNRRGEKSIWASVAYDDCDIEEEMPVGLLTQIFRWLLGLILLPVCWVTTWKGFGKARNSGISLSAQW